MEEMENKHHKEKKLKDKKINDLENGMKKIDIQPKKVNKTSATDAFQCKDCDFETNSKQGLKTHISRMHTQYEKEKY
jgi:hypothetical protein